MELKAAVKSIPIKTNVTVPSHFMCPISLDLMQDPVAASTGITYDRKSIETWLEMGNISCPVTNQPVSHDELIPNHTLRRLIQDWCVMNRSLGVERILTPRIPLDKSQASQILNDISFSGLRGDGVRCAELATKLRALGKESERNRRCVVSCGASCVLSSVLRDLSGEGIEGSNLGVLEEILSALVCFSPLDIEARRYLSSPSCLKLVVSILNRGNLAGRINAVILLKEIVSSLGTEKIELVRRTNGLAEALVKLIEKPISSQATKTTLVTIYYLVSHNEIFASNFAELGLVSLLTEILVDCDKSICEKALGILDGLFSSKKGREKGCRHALTVPILVKKMIRVSNLATNFSVSALWKLCKNCQKENCCVEEALKSGAFQKLLVLLQVSNNGGTKDKVSDLLKVLNGSKMSVECIESMDFRGIKRPF
ncbi:hypothetical protein LUZ60_003173 [Juncus effusus]|nr:hypothetical protein LUZ60_003173 [Juncus effusus]